MANNLNELPLGPIVNPETGEATLEFKEFIAQLTGTRRINSLGTLLSGVNAVKQASIEEAAADAENESAPDTAITVTASPSSVTKASASSGNTTSQDVTISISGGTEPYTIAWSTVSGHAFTNNSPASLALDGDITVAFTAPAGDRSGAQKITVTDSAGTPVVQTLTLSVNFFLVDGVNA